MAGQTSLDSELKDAAPPPTLSVEQAHVAPGSPAPGGWPGAAASHHTAAGLRAPRPRAWHPRALSPAGYPVGLSLLWEVRPETPKCSPFPHYPD